MGDSIELSESAIKAGEAIAKTTGIALETAQKFGAYLGEVFATVPHDVVGLLGGDYLTELRARNYARIHECTNEVLRERGVAPEEAAPISPRVGIPFLEKASFESDSRLQELWARLLANARDPNRAVSLRQEFTDILSQFEPTDALVLDALCLLEKEQGKKLLHIDSVVDHANLSKDEASVSVRNLDKLECVRVTEEKLSIPVHFRSAPMGRELLRACSK